MNLGFVRFLKHLCICKDCQHRFLLLFIFLSFYLDEQKLVFGSRVREYACQIELQCE